MKSGKEHIKDWILPAIYHAVFKVILNWGIKLWECIFLSNSHSVIFQPLFRVSYPTSILFWVGGSPPSHVPGNSCWETSSLFRHKPVFVTFSMFFWLWEELGALTFYETSLSHIGNEIALKAITSGVSVLQLPRCKMGLTAPCSRQQLTR